MVKIPKIQFTFPKIKKDSDETVLQQIKPTLKSTQILINGVLFTYILASIISGVVDLVFFSGLSKSFYNIFALSIPASIVMCLLSLVITSGKAWCAIKVEQIKALQNFLKNKGYTWYKNLNKPKRLWGLVHKLCAITSIITTISLSVVSIGTGLSNLEYKINNMTEDSLTIQQYYKDLENVKKESQLDKKENIIDKKNTNKAAAERANDLTNKAVSVLNEFLDKKNELINQYENLESEKYKEALEGLKTYYTSKIKTVIKITRGSIDEYDEQSLRTEITKYENSNLNILKIVEYDHTEEIKEAEENLNNVLVAIESKKYTNTKGELLNFRLEDGSFVSPQSAVAILDSTVLEYRNDTGDVGESSKMFTLLATYFKLDKTAGGFGVSELMIMILICFFGLLQEALIALLTPKVTIDRKTLFEYESYLPEFDEDDFMYYVYKKYLKKGVISQEDFYYKAEKCKNNKTVPEELNKFKIKKEETNENKYSDLVERKIKEVESL